MFMTYIFKLPDVGEGMAEGEIASWLVKVGDSVTEGQPIVEIQNDKLLQEIMSPHTGTVTAIMVEAGTVSKVGDPLIEFDGTGAGSEKVAEPEQPAEIEKPVAEPEKTKVAGVISTVDGINSTDQRTLAMPAIRRFAYQNGVDLQTVVGTGKRGQITKKDIDQALTGIVKNTPVEQPATKPVKAVVIEGQETREKMNGMRKAISHAMTKSKYTAPHVTILDEVEVTALVEHRTKFKPVAEAASIKLTYLPYIIKALVAVTKKYPILNASLDDETEEIIFKNSHNIGIATDTERGLMVPVIKNADQKSIFSLATAITELSTAAHDGTIKAAEMSEGTITITNIGSAGGAWFTPIINYPEVAILGIGRIQKQPIVNETDEIVVGQVLKLSLSFDHRLIDGMTAQKAMNELKRLLGNPEILLMEV